LPPEKVTDADIVLITHEHIDHCDPHTLPRLAQASPQARFVGPAPVLNKLTEWGIDSARLDPGVEDSSISPRISAFTRFRPPTQKSNATHKEI
jgi:L-ascorbate metabolism protein UlaG (beta-lactamase superfamily)